MTPSLTFVNLVEQEEGLVLHPYLDTTGCPTIGYGSTYYPNGKRVQMGDPTITQAEAVTYLMNYVTDEVTSLNALLKGITVNQNQFDALTDFAYNEGTPAFAGSTILRLMKANPNDPKIGPAFLLWDKEHVDGVLTTSSDLLQRRRREYKLYCTPI